MPHPAPEHDPSPASTALVPAGPDPRHGRPDDPAAAALAALIERLERVVALETASLGRTDHDAAETSHRKARGLLDLTRALRSLAPGRPDDALLARLTRLRDGLERNREVLRIHLDAAREVAQIVATAMREADSDGTYSPLASQGGLTR